MAFAMQPGSVTQADDGGMTAVFEVFKDGVHVADVEAVMTGAGSWTVIWEQLPGGFAPVDFRAWIKEATP